MYERRARARRVVITGIGAISPNGSNKALFWEAIKAGRSGIGPLTCLDAKAYPIKIAGQVNDFDPKAYMEAKKTRRLKRFSQFAVAAAKMAISDADYPLREKDSYRYGACFGSTMAGYMADREHAAFSKRGVSGISPTAWTELTSHSSTAYVCIELGLKGPASSISAGCCTGLEAVGWGYRAITNNSADMVVCGASEAPITAFGFSIMCASRILTTFQGDPAKASRPFAAGRDGAVLSEGGAALILEELDHALMRGARIYAEVLGYASCGEASDMVDTDPEGAAIAEAFAEVLSHAQLTGDDIDYVHAHGTGFPAGDIADTNAIKYILGERAYSIPVNSIRSMIGQALAAGGALQAASTALSVYHGIVPPTINCEVPDPLCDLDYVTKGARKVRIRYALMNGTSVGGTHAALLFGKYGKQRSCR